MQRWKRYIMITVLVIFSIFLAWFFTGKQFWFSSFFIQPVVTALSKIPEPKVSQQALSTPKKVNSFAYIHHTHRTFRKNCSKENLGTVKYEQVGGIYTWVDERGIKNYSDKKPHSRAELYRTTASTALDFFELDLQAPGLPSQFKNELSANLRAVFRAYTSLIGLKAMRKVKLNLHILPNSSAYNRKVKRLGGNPEGTAGVYFGSKNTAYIKYSTFEHTINVAIHEAVHAINEAVIGDTPQWLNEGLAEYFEYTYANMHTSIVAPNRSWVTSNGMLLKSVIQPYQLVHTKAHWHKTDYAKMYRSSWAFVHFLTSNTTYKLSLKKYLLAEQKSKCDVLNSDDVWPYLSGKHNAVAQDFSRFVKGKITVHRY